MTRVAPTGSGGGDPTARVLKQLRDYESPNVTYQAPDGSWPIVWRSARGTRVIDTAGRSYVDLTAAFGVAAAGHANPRVVQAACRQMQHLLHAMGDVHPHPAKAELARALSRLTFERWTADAKAGVVRGRTVFSNSGFEAVEVALKTALLATGRRGVLAFEGAYHGLGYGALEVGGRDWFRAPFRAQLGGFATFLPYPDTTGGRDRVLERVDGRLKRGGVGAVLVEPIQGRGGIRVPPSGFLRGLRAVCDARGVLLILDEIYTGLGRTGYWFACEAEGVVPDLVCLGKALTGGFPLSACVGRAELMERAWPPSNGEALHTSTYLGHPVGCAMALAQIREIERRDLVQRSATRGQELLAQLRAGVARRRGRLRFTVRGQGLMVGLEVLREGGQGATSEVWHLVLRMLQRGFLVLPEGEYGQVLALTPPLIIGPGELGAAAEALGQSVNEL